MSLKKKFGFIEAEQILNVKIQNSEYSVLKAGKGIPCLLIGLGTPVFRTLSKEFTNTFEIYSSDTYWVENESINDQVQFTMETIIGDIKALGDALNLKEYIIFAHSAYGIIALEFAKKYPTIARGIIMVGTPVNSNQSVATANQLIFEQQADLIRKAVDNERRAQIDKEDLNKLTSDQRWLREYVYRDAPRYWHIPDFDCSELWQGIYLSSLFIKLFNDILPATNVLESLEKIQTPIFLAAGISDYDCCPWMWQKVGNLPKNFIIYLFNQSGHWPHYEEPDHFNRKINEWVSTLS